MTLLALHDPIKIDSVALVSSREAISVILDKNRFDINQKVARVSKIFDWFPQDFIKHSETVQRYLGNYIDDPAIAESLLQNQFELKFLDYDWSLNGEYPT